MSSVEELYDKKQKDYYPAVDPERHNISRERQEVLELLSQCHRVLDIGCGNGSFLLSMSRMGHECFGLDISEPMVEHTRRLGFTARKINVEMESIPDDLGHFDAITMFEVLEHLYDPQEALKNKILPRLRPGGRFVCTVPNAAFIRYRLSILLGNIPSFGAKETGTWDRPYNLTHKTLFNFKGIKQTLEAAGLEKV